ncbi:MAG TPA: DUF3311 domain-containing protein [Candidatus Nitrosotalea sp.]|nr:DUF3311 domain-containing protein [Candidatus Nitrosotalea sp.]
MGSKNRYILIAVLVLIPIAIDLGVPIYNREAPELFGMPFFYWFQTLWLFVSAAFYMAYARLAEARK